MSDLHPHLIRLARPRARFAALAYLIANVLALVIVLYAGRVVGIGRAGTYGLGIVAGWALASLLHGRLLTVHLREIVEAYRIGHRAGRLAQAANEPVPHWDRSGEPPANTGGQ